MPTCSWSRIQRAEWRSRRSSFQYMLSDAAVSSFDESGAGQDSHSRDASFLSPEAMGFGVPDTSRVLVLRDATRVELCGWCLEPCKQEAHDLSC